MKRRPPPVPARTREILMDAQDRQTIRMALANGAVATPIGAVTYLRLPGRQDVMAFPTALVDAARKSEGAQNDPR
jgi:hypothetical protein